MGKKYKELGMMVKKLEEQDDSIKIALRTDGHAGGSDRSRILEADDAVGRSATPCRRHKNGFQPHSGSIDDCRQEKHRPLSQRLAGKTKSFIRVSNAICIHVWWKRYWKLQHHHHHHHKRDGEHQTENLASDSPPVLAEHAIIRTQIQSSYMFRLHKAAFIRPYVSENEQRKLYSCIIFFLHFLIHAV